jgi:hypothetical protein
VWFKHKAWIPIAWLLCLANLAAVGIFAQTGTPMHAAGHGVLAALFGLWAQRLRLGTTPAADADVEARLQELEARLAELETSPNVVARLTQMEERLDFAERVLVDVRSRAQLPPKE